MDDLSQFHEEGKRPSSRGIKNWQNVETLRPKKTTPLGGGLLA